MHTANRDFLPVVLPGDARVLGIVTYTTILEYLVMHFREQRRLFDDSIYDLKIGTYTDVVTVQVRGKRGEGCRRGDQAKDVASKESGELTKATERARSKLFEERAANKQATERAKHAGWVAWRWASLFTHVYGTHVYGTHVYGTHVYGTHVYGTHVYGLYALGHRCACLV